MVILSIIILSYNTKDLTLRCIESIVNQYKKELDRGEIEIVIVDNASKDGTIEMVKKEFLNRHSGNQAKPEHPESPDTIKDSGQARMAKNAQIISIQNKENLGFSKGCNIGAKQAKGQYLLFLNSDTEVLDRGFLKMTEFLDSNQKVGILGGRLLDPDYSPQSSTGKFYNLFNLFLMLMGSERFGLLRKSPKNIEKVDWVSGACMMIKKSLFKTLKGFDEHFFMYVEDMELCFRGAKLGILTFFYPNIKIIHQERGSSNRAFAIAHIYKGLLYFYSKHKSYWQYFMVKILLTVKAKALIFVGVMTKKSSLVTTYKRAIGFHAL